MNSYIINAEKLNARQLIPIFSFIILPFILYVFAFIETIVLVQFVLVTVFCLLIVLIWHFNTKIIICDDFIMYRSIFRSYKMYWSDIKKCGTFYAVGLSVISFEEKSVPGFLSMRYIYVTSQPDYKFNMVKKNADSFIRFHYNEKAFQYILHYIEPMF